MQGKSPTHFHILKLAEFFEVSTDEILGRTSSFSGVFEYKGEMLSIDEKELIGLFRMLEEGERKTFLSVARILCKGELPKKSKDKM